MNNCIHNSKQSSREIIKCPLCNTNYLGNRLFNNSITVNIIQEHTQVPVPAPAVQCIQSQHHPKIKNCCFNVFIILLLLCVSFIIELLHRNIKNQCILDCPDVHIIFNIIIMVLTGMIILFVGGVCIFILIVLCGINFAVYMEYHWNSLS